MKDFFIVGIGGFLGSTARYGVSVLFERLHPERVYLGTLSANLLGCFLIGLFFGYVSKWNHPLALFLMTGFCGGFTTFSTFSLEGFKLLRENLYSDFLIYAAISMIGGISLCILGHYITNKS